MNDFRFTLPLGLFRGIEYCRFGKTGSAVNHELDFSVGRQCQRVSHLQVRVVLYSDFVIIRVDAEYLYFLVLVDICIVADKPCLVFEFLDSGDGSDALYSFSEGKFDLEFGVVV